MIIPCFIIVGNSEKVGGVEDVKAKTYIFDQLEASELRVLVQRLGDRLAAVQS